MSIKVEVEIGAIEVNGEQMNLDRPKVKFESHWSWGDRVILVLPDGQRFTLLADELVEAVVKARLR